jgi:protein-disulfide isomerase
MAVSRQNRSAGQRLSQRELRAQRQAERRRLRWLRIGVVAVSAVILGVILFWPRPQPEPAAAARLTDDPVLGPASAPVTIVEYGDFGCPACRAWHRAGIREQVVAQYGDRVRFVWRDFPVITPQSPKAAEAAQCAYDQGRFWEYHDLLFARAPAIGLDELKSYAVEIGLDAEGFNACLDSGQHGATVDRDMQDAIARRFRGTPSFTVNDQPLAGPPTFEMLQAIIDPLVDGG